jgi:hypothetical protein
MKCSECQEVIPDDSGFCPECGARIGGVQPEPPVVAPAVARVAPAGLAAEARAPSQGKRRFTRLLLRIVVAVLAALGLLVVGCFALGALS